MSRRIRDLTAIIHAQLPEGIRDKLRVDVAADAFMLRVTATFTDQNKRTWKCTLEPEDTILGMSLKVPETFIAQLCVSV
jgi:hypothetical protein